MKKWAMTVAWTVAVIETTTLCATAALGITQARSACLPDIATRRKGPTLTSRQLMNTSIRPTRATAPRSLRTGQCLTSPTTLTTKGLELIPTLTNKRRQRPEPLTTRLPTSQSTGPAATTSRLAPTRGLTRVDAGQTP